MASSRGGLPTELENSEQAMEMLPEELTDSFDYCYPKTQDGAFNVTGESIPFAANTVAQCTYSGSETIDVITDRTR